MYTDQYTSRYVIIGWDLLTNRNSYERDDIIHSPFHTDAKYNDPDWHHERPGGSEVKPMLWFTVAFVAFGQDIKEVVRQFAGREFA